MRTLLNRLECGAFVSNRTEHAMPRVYPYKTIEDYDFDPNTSVTKLLIVLVAAIIMFAVVWAYFQP
jgi:hypothetical protein